MQSSEKKLSERIPYQTENTPLQHEMPCRVGYVATESTAIFGGSLVISGGTANGTILGEDPGNLAAQQFKVEATAIDGGYPSGTLLSVSSRTMLRRRTFDNLTSSRFIPDVSLGISGLSGAAGTFTLNLPFKKYWALPWLKRPFDTALDTGMFSSLLWTITNGAASRQFSGNDRTFNYAGVYWDIYHQFQAYKGVGLGPIAVLFDDDKVKNIGGANARLEINKELVSDGIYTDLLIMSETTNQALADTIVNKITAAASTDEFFNAYSLDLKAEMEDMIGDASTTSTPRTGLYFFTIADDGCLTNGKSDLSLTIDQNNPGTDRFIIARRQFQWIPDRLKQKGGGVIKTGATAAK
jgi:hypothetical protein